MTNTEKALDYAKQNRERFLNDLNEVLRIPSISTDAEYKSETLRAAQWMADHLKKLGMENVEIMPTDNGGHPVIYGDYLKKSDAPTVLVYGHYDVQPVEPLDQWISGPFDPTVRDGNLYARGATDDKGQVIIHVNAQVGVPIAV